MRFYHSLPQNKPFFQYYAGLIPALFKVGYLSQVFSAAIELFILLSILRPKFEAANVPSIAAPITAAALVLLLEGGLRTGAAYSVRAVLNRKFSGLDLPMTVFVWVLAAALLVCSLTLHIEGAKEAVEANAAPPRIENTAHTEQAAAAEQAAANRNFSRDSSAIMATYGAQIEAAKVEGKARARAATARKGGTYAAAMVEQAAAAAKVAELEQGRAAALAAAMDRANATTAAARERRDAAAARIEGRNDKERTRSEAKTEKYSGYLSVFSVLTVVFFLVTIALNEIHKKGSGIESVAITSPYHFEPGVLAKFWAAISEKFQYHARTTIDRIEYHTPTPPPPHTPNPVFDWQKLGQGTAPLTTRERIAPRISPHIAAQAATTAARARNLRAAAPGASVTIPARTLRALL